MFPNPVSNTGKVSLVLDKPADVTVRIMDITGKLMSEQVYRNGQAGENTFDFSAENLPSGTYMLAATVANTRTQARLFIVRK